MVGFQLARRLPLRGFLLGTAICLSMVPSRPASAQFSIDTVTVIDGSGSMGGAFSGIATTIGRYASSLETSGNTARFGLTVFDRNRVPATPYELAPGRLFGTAAEFNARILAVGPSGGDDEDGFDGVDEVLTRYRSLFASGARRSIVMVTDTGRAARLYEPGLSDAAARAKLVAAAQAARAAVSVVLPVTIRGTDGTNLSVAYRSSDGTWAGFNPSGMVVGVARKSDGSLDIVPTYGQTSVAEYVRLATETGGAVANINLFGTASNEALTSALAAALQSVEVIVVPVDATSALVQSVQQAAQAELRQSVRGTQRAISQRLAAILGATIASRQAASASRQLASADPPPLLAQSGPAAGPPRTGAWVDGSVGFLNNTAANDRATGRVHSALFGIDHRVTDGVLVGVAFTVENTNVQLKSQTSRQRGNGGLVSPYAAYVLSDTVILDAQLTMGRVDRNLERNRATGQATGDYASRRLGAAANLTAYLPIEAFDLRSSIGYAYNVDRPDGFVLDDQTRVDLGTTKLGQVQSNHELSFGRGEGLVPYAGALLEFDTTRASSADRFGTVFSVGFRYGAGTDLTLGAFASFEVGRPNQSTSVVGANARLSF